MPKFATREEILRKVIEVTHDQMGGDKERITEDTHFVNDLDADSLDVVELVMEFEDAFEMSIPEEDVQNIQTVRQSVEYIQSRKEVAA